MLEFLLGQYCSSDDETIIEQGVQNVKRILADNFVRPDEAQKILSQLRKNGSHTIIDMVTVHLDIKKDCFFAEFSNLGLTNVPITDDYPEKYDRLLCGGIWCIVQLEYESEGDSSFGITDIDGQPISSKQKKQKDISPISIHKLTPIQMPHIDIEEVREGRKAFTQEEWMDVMLRSCGYEPEQLNNRGESGCCLRVCYRWWRTTSISVSWGRAAQESPISIKKSARTVSWYPVVRRPLQICFTIWGAKP